MRRLAVVGLLALLAGCVARHQRPPEPTRAEQLLEVVTRARVAAASGQREEADALLGRFIEANPSTPESREAAYWRAILRLEAATSRADRDEARHEDQRAEGRQDPGAARRVRAAGSLGLVRHGDGALTARLFYSSGACSLVPHVALEEAGANFEAVRTAIAEAGNPAPTRL